MPDSNFSDSARKPWTIVRRFDHNLFLYTIVTPHRKCYIRMKLKFIILVCVLVCAGNPGLIQADMVKEGAAVIDFGKSPYVIVTSDIAPQSTIITCIYKPL